MSLHIRVIGTPAPQGSKRHVGHGVMVESSKKVKPWREAVKHAARRTALETGWPCAHGGLSLSALFILARPKAHYRTGRFAHLLKSDAPTVVPVKPDLDKLLRSTFDALGDAGVWRDDSQIVDVLAAKIYATADGAFLPGAVLNIDTCTHPRLCQTDVHSGAFPNSSTGPSPASLGGVGQMTYL